MPLNKEQMERAIKFNIRYAMRHPERWDFLCRTVLKMGAWITPHSAILVQAIRDWQLDMNSARSKASIQLVPDGMFGDICYTLASGIANDSHVGSRAVYKGGVAVQQPKQILTPSNLRFEKYPASYKLRNKPANLIVLHWDAAASSTSCFHTLVERGLSIHFTIDRAGSIRQHLDLDFVAQHAAPFNSQSIGIEINGAADFQWESPNRAYQNDENVIKEIPPNRVRHGRYKDFTTKQKESVMILLNQLVEIVGLNGIIIPRERKMKGMPLGILPSITSDITVCGHYHLTRRKMDPGFALMKWLANQYGVEVL